jgi:regulator of nucleoside diphosphate kinase
MQCKTIVISNVDKDRLEPMIRDAVAGGAVRLDRLRILKSKLDDAEVCAPDVMPGDVVTMNSKIRLRDVDTDEVETFTLVYPGFANIAEGCLSVLTPIGAAVLGYRKGDVVEDSAFGSSRMLIEEVEFQPESVGRYDV